MRSSGSIKMPKSIFVLFVHFQQDGIFQLTLSPYLHFLASLQDKRCIPLISGLPEGVLSNRPCSLVCLSLSPSVFKYLGHRPLVFSESFHEGQGQQSKRSDTAGIFKKILIRGLRWIKCKKLGFWTFSRKLVIKRF